MSLTIEKLAAEKGYRLGKTKEGPDDYRLVTLRKGKRSIQIDDELLDDIAGLSSPLPFKAKEDVAA